MGTFRVRVSEGVGGFVSFFAAGEPAAGEFRCSECGYGVSVSRVLPRCPMCCSETWEEPRSAAVQGQSPNRWSISCQAATTKAAEMASSTVSAT